MAFLVSPGVAITETDISTIIPNVSASNCACVGQLQWGPVLEINKIDNEDQLVNIFGKPTATVYKDFLTMSSFLAYATNLNVVRVVGTGALNASATASAGGAGQLINNLDAYSHIDFTSSLNLWIAVNPGVLGNSIKVAWADATTFNAVDSNSNPTWPYHSMFSSAPASGEFHIVVVDADGKLTGTIGSVLEKYAFVSTTVGAKQWDGSSNYVVDVISKTSAWILVGKAALLTGGSVGVTLAAGADGSAVTASDREAGWNLFADADNVDISLAFVGDADITGATWVLQNIGETRKDCVVFVSPLQTDVVNVTASVALTNTLATRTSYGSTSYGVMDSAYKLMYDRYNDVNRQVPLNGDIAGLAARATNDKDAWWSPAGYDRGGIKNCIKLSYVQSQSIRDALYQAGVNPVISPANQGPMLYGDKTMQTKPSAFDHIGVRRLFILLEKAIATFAKFELFEFNDDITRAQFLNTVNPFLNTIKGRRGLTNFKVVCDSTNNTSDVIARNEFVASIYILPNYSINYIQLNFVAVNNAVQFDETVVR